MCRSKLLDSKRVYLCCLMFETKACILYDILYYNALLCQGLGFVVEGLGGEDGLAKIDGGGDAKGCSPCWLQHNGWDAHRMKCVQFLCILEKLQTVRFRGGSYIVVLLFGIFQEPCRFKIMGNCMETQTVGQRDGADEKQEQEEERGRRFVKVNESEGSMKVVLTKEELKWLIVELKEKKGLRLEEMVAQIERVREEKVEGWKPSLDSIMEAPEVLEMDTTSSFS
ncbi:hypothetical protein VNO80_08675 [Phaseolus coccineus]|uniref:Uncharacterized protein n=1 Tax=Phaseolus coccineus TaxID=3886 RepID=A0AAN9RD11_PHACN